MQAILNKFKSQPKYESKENAPDPARALLDAVYNNFLNSSDLQANILDRIQQKDDKPVLVECIYSNTSAAKYVDGTTLTEIYHLVKKNPEVYNIPITEGTFASCDFYLEAESYTNPPISMEKIATVVPFMFDKYMKINVKIVKWRR